MHISIVTVIFSNLFKTCSQKKLKTRVQQICWFSRLLNARSVIFTDFGGPGAHPGSPGRHFKDFQDYCDFGRRSGTTQDINFPTNSNTLLTFQYYWLIFSNIGLSLLLFKGNHVPWNYSHVSWNYSGIVKENHVFWNYSLMVGKEKLTH